jgi:hypothetical protein
MEGASPSPAPQDGTDLDGYLASPAGDIGPVVAQSDDASPGHGVVPVDITPSVMDQMCRVSAELHGNAEFLIQIVQVPKCLAEGDPRLPLGPGQLMRSFDAPHIPVLQWRMNTIGNGC